MLNFEAANTTLIVKQCGTVKKYDIDSRQTFLSLKQFFGQALKYSFQKNTFTVCL